jgi:2-(3-amino-3-carboxypropyl)histidine synthase
MMETIEYDLELDKAVALVKNSRAKKVCIQLPDGLKPRAAEIADRIERETSATVLIWEASCFGACDVPQINGVDLLIQFGHSEWV